MQRRRPRRRGRRRAAVRGRRRASRRACPDTTVDWCRFATGRARLLPRQQRTAVVEPGGDACPTSNPAPSPVASAPHRTVRVAAGGLESRAEPGQWGRECLGRSRAVVSGLGHGVANMLLRDRSARSTDRAVQSREAAGGLLGPLRDLGRLARAAEHAPRTFGEWAYAMPAFADAWDRLRHRLPGGAQSSAAQRPGGCRQVSRRACVGGPEPAAAGVDVAEHDAEWRAHAEDFLADARPRPSAVAG